ncbi:hypothetical protein D9756_002682 [Leucocoprinus leucothites]|uniref:Uncharacterized protein n=1 Tax=Leucocoprinus leucothites TaxID=201217 RepID=A0A8H5GC53_9AGAR|nr:hypothetical protein D9756_002682 [Leucoagaricus leucothites]
MDALAGMDDTSSEDDTASQTTEDELPQNQPPPLPAPVVRPAPPPPPQLPAPPVRVSRVRPLNYELRNILWGHTMSISAVKFSSDNKLLASCEKIVKMWNPENGEFVRDLSGHAQGLSDIAWLSHSTSLASASDDTTIRI